MSNVRFAVFTDLHYDHIHDGNIRIQNMVEKLKCEKLDFVIQLGDFAFPIKENLKLIDKINELKVPFYSVLGNHDTDNNSREEVLKFLDMKSSYYSFYKDHTKFIVLDSCFVKTEDSFKVYQRNDYNKDTDTERYPYVPNYILNWLKNEFNDNSQFYVLFSHHSVTNEFGNRGIINRKVIQDLISITNEKNKKVILFINGHDHGEDITYIDGTCYYALNAMSYIWVGPDNEHFSYSEEEHAKYPFLKDLILYKEGLYAIITIDEAGNFEIEGMNSDYLRKSPQQLKIGYEWNGRSILPKISSLTK